MIGFDRPLRPRWIYESLTLAESGQRLIDLNLPFEEIARELTGKEGKRKARTVLFRIFLRDETNKARVRRNLHLKILSQQYGMDKVSPIYLFYLIAMTSSLQTVLGYLARLYRTGDYIHLSFLKEKMVDSFGQRDVVSRSAGAFLQTLEHFGILSRIEGEGRYLFIRKLELDQQQMSWVLLLYAREVVRAPQISLEHLPAWLPALFVLPDLKVVAQTFNGVHWDYQHRMTGELLIVY